MVKDMVGNDGMNKWLAVNTHLHILQVNYSFNMDFSKQMCRHCWFTSTDKRCNLDFFKKVSPYDKLLWK